MAQLFVTPSSVINRIRDFRESERAKNPLTFPDFGVFGSGEIDLAQKSAKTDTNVNLYVYTSNGSGSLMHEVGNYPTTIATNIEIILLVTTEDSRAQHADELGICFKNFLVEALHTWDEYDVPGNEPVRMSSDSPFGVDGHAVYGHIYRFTQIKEVGDDCFDSTGTWEELDWFNLAVTESLFRTNQGDENTIITNAYPNGNPPDV